ncbi:MAG: hypothetical protein JJT75_11955 [Opitutales bacterium]|nr:hypothetical protein [Opitutales bacterium]MCH8540523.1 hypothetical protein [Opitutales bacterium]
MNKLLLFFVSGILFPVILFAEANPVPQVPTRAEADTAISAEMQAREDREAERMAAIEAVPSFEEWELDHGNRKTILRRVAAPPQHVTIRESESTDETTTEPKWSEEEIAAWIAAQPVPRSLNLSAVVYDRTFTEITWRDEDQREWTVLSNIDFRYLGGIGHFEDQSYHWMTFLFVDEVDSEKETQTARLAAEKGFDYTPRTAERWLNILPSDFLPTSPLHDSTTPSSPEYIIIAEHEGSAIPAELYEKLDALHQHYHAHEERLVAEYERRKVLNEARRAYREANPPEPKDTVINFWRVE